MRRRFPAVFIFYNIHSRPQCLRGWECARKFWETLRRSSRNLAIWASQRVRFDRTKTCCFFYIYFIAKVLCCLGIRTEEIQLTALKNFQVSKALVVAAEKIPLNVPSHRFETWSLHMLDSWLNYCGLLHFGRPFVSKIMAGYTCGFFPRILAIIPARRYTCAFLPRILAFFPALWVFYSQVYDHFLANAHICANKKGPYICVTNKHVYMGPQKVVV